MSMQRGCIVVQWTKKEYYCITAHEEYDFDFRDYTVTGPKSTAKDAFETHDGCNPSSYTVLSKDGKKLSDAYPQWIIKAIRKYKKQPKNNYRRKYGRPFWL